MDKDKLFNADIQIVYANEPLTWNVYGSENRASWTIEQCQNMDS